MSAKASCGPQVTVVNTEHVRIARCPCGTFHVTLVQAGVTVQLTGERMAELGRAIGVAVPPAADVSPSVRATPIN